MVVPMQAPFTELEARLAHIERRVAEARSAVQRQRERLATLQRIHAEAEATLAALSATLDTFLRERELGQRQADQAVREYCEHRPLLIETRQR
jgi:hypothetical protein